MHIIFTDIDGVLNSRRTPNPRRFPYVADPKLVSRFKELVDRTGAQVVLASTWRYDPAGIFSANYWGIPFADVTPDLPDKPRRDEILAWIGKHSDVDRYVVIDDEDDELDGLPLFQPSCHIGLTDKIVSGAASYLSGKTHTDMRCGRLTRVLQNCSAIFRGHPG
jgi:HAD domain in Swiss Army Knife RNA repair proteins